MFLAYVGLGTRGLDLRLKKNNIHLVEWPVEYTDEFGSWWDTLTEAEQISIDAHVRKLEQRGPNLPFPIRAASIGRGMPICGSCAYRVEASPCACSTPSIRDAWPSC